MKVLICSLASPLHAETLMPASQEKFIRELWEALATVSPDLDLTFGQDVAAVLSAGDTVIARSGDHPGASGTDPAGGLALVYVRTGGTEGAFKAALAGPDGALHLPRRPVLLLTSGQSNSLAASMEILSFLRQNGCAGEILHGRPDYIAGRIVALAAGPGAADGLGLGSGFGSGSGSGSGSGDAPSLHKSGGNVQAFPPDAPSLHKSGENVQADAAPAASVPGVGRRPFRAEIWRPLLAGKRLGIIGRPSDWLISSDVDPAVAQRELGLELVDVPMDELVAEIRTGGCDWPDGIRWPSASATVFPSPSSPADPDFSACLAQSPSSPSDPGSSACQSQSSPSDLEIPSDPEIPAGSGTSSGPLTQAFRPRFGRTLTPDVFNGAMDIYGALCRLIARYRLDGLTLRCFDLLTEVGNTGCMALAILNAQGIPSSCEGDVPALISMLIGHALTGCCGFQANPARIDPLSGEMLLAHCTVPLDMIRRGEYDTHFESGIGVAVRGELPEGPVTIFKVAPDLRQCFAADAELVRNQAERDLCRTQVVLHAPGTARYFLTDSIGNHHIILPGHHAASF